MGVCEHTDFDRYFSPLLLHIALLHCSHSLSLAAALVYVTRACCCCLKVCASETHIVLNIKNQFFSSFIRCISNKSRFFFARFSFPLHSFMFYAMYTYFSSRRVKRKKKHFLYGSIAKCRSPFRVFVLRRSFHELLLPFIICGGRCYNALKCMRACVCMRLLGVVVKHGRDAAGCVYRLPARLPLVKIRKSKKENRKRANFIQINGNYFIKIYLS